jgi:hypothetical protein
MGAKIWRVWMPLSRPHLLVCRWTGPNAPQDAAARWGLKLHFFIVVNLLDKYCPLGPCRVEPVPARSNSLRKKWQKQITTSVNKRKKNYFNQRLKRII